MKVITIMLLAVVAGVCAAAAGETKCSSVDGDFQYTYWFYQGGAPPRFPTTRQTWTYKGQPFKEGDFSDRTVIKDETEGHTRTEVYVATLTFKTNAGPVQDFVLCRSTKYVGPPMP
ncbi:MAG: hypothetical protein HY077_14505 [Elusimicrobia bacterium]|nr:hypothetical protein [Elusimicrobiota bacterium]